MIHSKASAWSNTVEYEFRRPVIIDERIALWHQAVVERLNHICRLRAGWDGYQARPVDFGTANFAFRILQSVDFAGLPAPSVVPGVSGDLQLEWHTASWDVEIRILAPNKVEAWRAPADDPDAEGEAIKATVDFTTINSWVRRLAEPALADFVSAA